MTAISAPRPLTRATPFERTLLHAASAIDRFVALRLERRSNPEYRRAHEARARSVSFRDAAVARGAIGVIPR